MKTRHTPERRAPSSRNIAPASSLPDADALAALRGWYAGLSSRDTVERYLPHALLVPGASARGILGRIRRQLAAFAHERHRPDLVALFSHPASERTERSTAVLHAITLLPGLADAQPQITDDIGQWLRPRAVRVLRAHGVVTLADLTVRVPRRRQWWRAIEGLGAATAIQIEAFFAAYPNLTERARALVVSQLPAVHARDGAAHNVLAPWERIHVPPGVDGTDGTFRAPSNACTLDANNDYEAVQAWLSLHEAPTTQRAYRKEAERLILWAIVERHRALSSLTTEDAIAYRAFILAPSPRNRWVGPPRPRHAPDWRPFARSLSARSAAYALSVLGALFRWLIEQRYVLANPFAGVKVRGRTRVAPLDTSRGFTDGEWQIVRSLADGLEWSYGWEVTAAQRLRFVLDFAYATGLRAGELVSTTLGDVLTDANGDHWLRLIGKGSRPGKVALPPLARHALEQSLLQRGLPVTPARWQPKVPLLARLGDETDSASITPARLWHVMRRFFMQAARLMEADHPPLAEKLRRASPHWMRHTHATHALARGAELTTVRDNLRHASIATTSIYLQGDEVKRARQLDAAFGRRT
ncbi:phage integrase family protein [Paraburkholderia sp. NPDC080076]|uniref:phage integrase family protein n=1 Tax=Paraburkholderia sp. NPDC080076 TaxID=3390605 RepID=UPI003CFECCBD